MLYSNKVSLILSQEIQSQSNSVKWLLRNTNQNLLNQHQNIVNINQSLHIVGMQLNQLTLTCRSNYMFDKVKRKRISVLVEEFSSQSFISQENNKFHFIGYAGLTFEADPAITIETIDFYDFNNGIYIFNDPVKDITSITLSLFSPFQPLLIDSPFTEVVISNSNPAIITFISPHLLYRDIISISKFNSNTNVDTLINQSFNNYTITSANTITIPVDTSILPTSYSAIVYIPVTISTQLDLYTY